MKGGVKLSLNMGHPYTPSFQSARNAELYEPRIPHIRRLLESVLSVVTLESGGKPVSVDGFRLKDLDSWLVASGADPAEVIDSLATRCDCRCSFCYIRGNPPSLALEQPSRGAEEELAEAQTRLKYFSPPAKRALFPALGSPHEFLCHPYALDLLTDLRKKTDRPLRLSTNGNNLTEEFIRKLSSLKPVYLYLSLEQLLPSAAGPDHGREETARPAFALFLCSKRAEFPMGQSSFPGHSLR